MKKVFLFFLLLLLCVAPVFADDELSDDSEPIQIDNTSTTPVVVDITQLLNNNLSTGSDSTDDIKEIQQVEIIEPELVSVTTTQQRISASDTSGFKSVILALLGDYETVVTDYEYRTGSNTYYSHSISIERDWAWICSAGIFAIVLWCTFRSIGGILCRT